MTERTPFEDEQVEAVLTANALLDIPYADPDDDLRMLSRQLLRRHEELARLTAAMRDMEWCGLSDYCLLCGRTKDQGHNSVCRLGAALNGSYKF
jgi:hypothetical protein